MAEDRTATQGSTMGATDHQREQFSTYVPLTDVSHVREFRLIKLHADHDDALSCELRRYKIHHSPPFRALSYTWQNPFDSDEIDNGLTEDIIVDRKPMTVGKNLATALKALRDWHESIDAFVWADAICIDQTNFRERAYQVAIMGEIFCNADSVFVWLGPEAQDSDKAISFMKVLARCHRDRDTGRTKTLGFAQNPKYQAHWRALAAIWNRRWWSRAWVLQETVLARKVEFCCGRIIIDEVDLFDSGLAMREVWDKIYNILDSQYDIRLPMPTHHAMDGMNRLRTNRMHGTIFPILTCHFRTMSPQATDPRDYIFAKLGMASDGYIVRPSYADPVHEVYTGFVMDHIQETKSLDIIHFDARPRTIEHIPSWVPDWSADYAAVPLRPDHRGDPRTNLRYYSASQGEPADVSLDSSNPESKKLQCKGYAFDIIDGVARAEESSWAGTAVARPLSQPRSTKCAYSNEADIFDGIWRAVTMEPEVRGDVPPSETGYILAESFMEADARLAGTQENSDTASRLRFDAYWACIGPLNVFGMTVAERMAQAAMDSPTHSVPISVRVAVETAATNGLQFRKVLTTEKGYLGSGPIEATPGDVLAILLGCSVPVVLRPIEEGQHTVVGEAYIQGIMYGEALEALKREGAALKTFCLA